MKSTDNYITRNELLSPNTHKFKRRILLAGDPKDPTKVLTAYPVINNKTKELVAFVELKWGKGPP